MPSLKPNPLAKKAKMLTKLLEDVKFRHGVWNLDFLFDWNEDEAMKEVLQYH